MSKRYSKKFHCDVIHEAVKITLKNKPTRGLQVSREKTITCDQSDCQYVENMVPPCPLTLEIFKAELEEIEKEKVKRKEDAQNQG